MADSARAQGCSRANSQAPVQTLGGADVTIGVNGTTVTVNNATVVIPDIYTTTGVIHVIDEVIEAP